MKLRCSPWIRPKSRETLQSFYRNAQPTLLSWKMDGLTIVLTYENGEAGQKAVTRGNGIVGEVITNNARTFQEYPAEDSPIRGSLVLRGEAIITYSDFERINEDDRRCQMPNTKIREISAADRCDS